MANTYSGGRNTAIDTTVLIVGAGMAGLAAAVDLQQNGFEVLVVDKGRGVGGRLATRRIGPAAFDHGAQFITARSDRFSAAVESWVAQGVLVEWFRGADGGHPRWRGVPAMTGVAKHLAADIDVLLGKRVISIWRSQAGWRAVFESGEAIQAGAVVLTAPVPQSLALLDAGRIDLVPETRARLEAITYDPCISVMALLGGPANVPHPGGFAPPKGPVAWIADNQSKGVSAVPAVTIHASPEYSQEHWDRDRDETARDLLRAAAPWLGAEVLEYQVHGWRYARPKNVEESGCLVLNQHPPLLIAGDAFAAPRVEGAALSGWSAAEILMG